MAKTGYFQLVFVLLLTCTGVGMATAQSFPAGNVLQNLEVTAFDRESRTVYTLWKDSLRLWEGPDYASPKTQALKGAPENFPLAYEPVPLKPSLYFVHVSGGLVYKLEGDSLERIDRSFNHKMQINSTILPYNDTILRYGGYGFWSHRNFFTYFSDASREWEVIPPTGSQEVPRGRQDAQITVDEPYIYVFSGVSQDRINPLQNMPNREVWRFDMDARRWEQLGEASQDLYRYYRMAHMGDKILYVHPNRPTYIMADPRRNTLAYYNRKPEFQNAVGLNKEMYRYQSYYADSTFFLLRMIRENGVGERPWKGNLRYDLVDYETFLGSPVAVEPMYTKTGFPWAPVGGVLGATALLGVLWYGRKRYQERNKVVVSRKGIRYGRQSLEFDPTTREVLELLLRNPEGVYSQQILDLVEKPDLNPAHNIKVKNQVIESLNFRLKSLLGLEEDLIESYRSPQDKRIKRYKIRHSYFRLR